MIYHSNSSIFFIYLKPKTSYSQQADPTIDSSQDPLNLCSVSECGSVSEREERHKESVGEYGNHNIDVSVDFETIDDDSREESDMDEQENGELSIHENSEELNEESETAEKGKISIASLGGQQ